MVIQNGVHQHDQNGNATKNGHTNGHAKSSFYEPPQNLKSKEKELMEVINQKYHTTLGCYNDLHAWSCEHYSEFWETVLTFCDIKLGSEYSQVIDRTKGIADFPKWFSGATLNYAENCLRGEPDAAAFITSNVHLECTTYTYQRLREDVERLATALRQNGITQNDTVCGFLPNTYETSVAMFATAAIGAAWCSASVDFGPSGVLDRFRQVRPKLLFSAEAVTYKGKRFDLTEKLDKVVEGLPTLEKVVVINMLDSEIDLKHYKHSGKYEVYDDFIVDKKQVPTPFVYQQVSFDHPLFIMFSSGTTGIPKAMVHTVGGTLLKHVEEHLIQGNTKSTDRILFYTTCGWMMWNWLMTFTFAGGCIVLYDESPMEPDPHILLKLAAKTKCTMLGMGAKLYDAYTRMNVDFKSLYDLSSLHMIYSTGSPLKAAAFEFINEHIAPKAIIGSISGGTDIIGCFMGCSTSLPVYAGECQCLYLGMNMKSFNPEGEPVLDEQGELVCLTPFPSMPSHFLGDQDHSRYKKAYFERFQGIWAHGDFCQINSKTGGVVMLGRSDATLNRGGVRIGTAEIYSVVERLDEIDDCLAVGQLVAEAEDEHIVLFVKLAGGHELTDALKTRLVKDIRMMMSPRHVPNQIFAVDDIPYTNSGKKVEMAVKQIINGEKVQKASSLRNPDSLDLYEKFRLNEKAH